MTPNPLPAGTDEALADARRHGITIFGAGGFAGALATAAREHGVEVRAFVVSRPTANSLAGTPVSALADLSEELKRLPMWIGVFNRNRDSDLADLFNTCRAAGIADVLLPQHYFDVVGKAMGWRFWLVDRARYRDAEADIAHALTLLDDATSRRQLEQAIAFRLGTTPAIAPQPDAEPQYFPRFITAVATAVEPGIHFVDGGAYDGDTLAQAARHLRLAGAFAFEPDPENFRRLSASVAKLQVPSCCWPCGLSDRTARVAFSGGEGESCAINDNGTDSIQALRLDDCLQHQPVSFIKLDIEGHELAALAGATAIITRHRPLLAIAGYHLWDDLWTIPDFIARLDLGYRIGYRMHAHNTFDAVFYAY